jgi:hypothetical protein
MENEVMNEQKSKLAMPGLARQFSNLDASWVGFRHHGCGGLA